jgi:hypothetical protein
VCSARTSVERRTKDVLGGGAEGQVPRTDKSALAAAVPFATHRQGTIAMKSNVQQVVLTAVVAVGLAVLQSVAHAASNSSDYVSPGIGTLRALFMTFWSMIG